MIQLYNKISLIIVFLQYCGPGRLNSRLDTLRLCYDVLESEVTELSSLLSKQAIEPEQKPLAPLPMQQSEKSSPRNAAPLSSLHSPKMKTGHAVSQDGFPRENRRQMPVSGGLQPISPGTSLAVLPAFLLADKIDGRYMGGNKWFPGKITSVNRDGTYDVKYSDGDDEQNVAPSFLRLHDAQHHSKKEHSLGVNTGVFVLGEAVEAKYLGGAKWFAGKISAVNADKSYDVHYNDGETETAIAVELIRSISLPAPMSHSHSHSTSAAPASPHQIRTQAHPVLAPLVKITIATHYALCTL